MKYRFIFRAQTTFIGEIGKILILNIKIGSLFLTIVEFWEKNGR